MSVPPKTTPNGTWMSGVKVRHKTERLGHLWNRWLSTCNGVISFTKGHVCTADKEIGHPVGSTFTQEESSCFEQVNGQCSLKWRILGH